MLVARFYLNHMPEILYDVRDDLGVTPMVGDKIHLNQISFVVVSRVFDYDSREVRLLLEEQPNTPW